MHLGMISLGCAKNLVDSELFLGLAQKYKLTITNDINQADIIVINTCGFIESAKKEALDTIIETLEYQKQGTKIIVMGCLVERYLTELQKDIPEVDYYLPVKDYPKVDELFKKITGLDNHYCFDYQNRLLSTKPSFAYIKIGEGCNNKCHYCAIPLIRGSYHSRKLESLIDEAKYLFYQGIQEIVLIAQDTTRYGSDLKNTSLAVLLEKLAQLNLFKVIRVLYLYPDEITDELLQVMKKYDCIAKYFDIPLQHASDKILKNMNRRGQLKQINELIDKIKASFVNPILRTTFIVGFPTENDDDFNILKSFISKQQFDHIGVFTYSDEEDTVAYQMTPKVDIKVANKRKETLMLIQKDIVEKKNQNRIGEEVFVVVDKYDPVKNCYLTRSYAEAPDDVDGYILVKSIEPIKTKCLNVKITSACGYDLTANIISENKTDS